MKPIDLRKLPEAKMRQPGYYAAKFKGNESEEIVKIDEASHVWRIERHCYFFLSNFEWISDTPIGVEKMPVKLVHQHYYVVKKVGEFVAMWNEDFQKFVGQAQEHTRESVQVVSGPFSIEQLIKLKPE